MLENSNQVLPVLNQLLTVGGIKSRKKKEKRLSLGWSLSIYTRGLGSVFYRVKNDRMEVTEVTIVLLLELILYGLWKGKEVRFRRGDETDGKSETVQLHHRTYGNDIVRDLCIEYKQE